MNKVLCKDIFSSKKLQQFYSMAFPTSTSFTCRFPHLSVLLETVAREDRVGKPVDYYNLCQPFNLFNSHSPVACHSVYHIFLEYQLFLTLFLFEAV